MKKNKFFLIVTFIFLITCLSACSYDSLDSVAGGDGDYAIDEAVPPASVDDDELEEVGILPGQLTAAAYNDNDSFEFWRGLLSSSQEAEGIFKNYYEQFAFKTYNRIKINVPISVPTKISLLDDNNNVLSTAHSDVNGVGYLFPTEEKAEYKIELEYMQEGEEEATTSIETITGDTTFELTGINNRTDAIQIMFVIDTTGSMGDEINYIKAEIADTISRVKSDNDNVYIELALMVYRDSNDAYVTRYSDFTTDIDAQQSYLSNQSAGGGGDFEEAVDVALSQAALKQWSSSTNTKILIHVADAPAHDSDIAAWNSAVYDLAAKGVHIITVASSGINKKTEYFFRNQSLITNGSYVYLTDDSGIGNSHIEATVEEGPVVEYLNSCLIRLINGYYTGVFSDPVYYQNDVNA